MEAARSWGGHLFEWVAQLRPDADAGGNPLELMPQGRYAKAQASRLHSYGRGPFCRFQIPWRHTGAGVYLISVGDRAMYVGECRHLGERFNMGYGSIQPRNCYAGGQQTNCRINTLVLEEVKRGAIPVLWFVESEERPRLETELIPALDPPWNRAGR